MELDAGAPGPSAPVIPSPAVDSGAGAELERAT